MNFIKILFICIIIYSRNLFASDYMAALVADMDTGQILYQENANELNYPASLTKIMTLYLVFDAIKHQRLNLDDYLIVSNVAIKASPVKLGLKSGSKIKVEDAIKALIVHSANDVARVLAENLKGGKEESFASLMTNVAIEIGLSPTNFENSSGLPNDEQISTARDIALLSIAIYKHFPEFWKYFNIKTWNYEGKQYINGNRLLREYPGCDGMKTGYTNKSKYSLIATAKNKNKKLISVVLGAKDKNIRAKVSIDLLNRGFSKYNISNIKINKSNEVVDTLYNTGIQCGAFSDFKSAQKQSNTIFSIINKKAIIEEGYDKLFRVKIRNVENSLIHKLKSKLKSNNIDCFIFYK